MKAMMVTKTTRIRSPRLLRKVAVIAIGQTASERAPDASDEVDDARASMLAELEALEELGRPPALRRGP
jgi:hypothetical protein